MTKALEAVLERVIQLPDDRQDEIAGALARLVEIDVGPSSGLSAAHWAEIDRRLAREPKYASEEEVEAFFRASLS